MVDDEEEVNEKENSSNLGSYEGDRNERNERHDFGKTKLPYEDIKRELIDFLMAILQQGDSVKNKRHRRGILHCPNGSKYDGEWNENVREGHRTYTYAGANISFEIFR